MSSAVRIVSYVVVNLLVLSGSTEMTSSCPRRDIGKLILDLNWSHVAILHDTSQGSEDAIQIPGHVKQQWYNLDTIDTLNALGYIHQSSPRDINLLVVLNDTSAESAVQQIDNFDFSNGTTDLRHNSRVVVFIANASNIMNTTIHLENLAVCVNNDYLCDPETDPVYELYTLHLHPGQRVLLPVALGEGALRHRLFPNVKYGYNNRRLLVTTLESKPYVIKEHDKGRVFYTGYVFDILTMISRRLNFSFDVTEPADRNWGVLEQGQWNGMVGQLIRKEADVAAADLSVYYGRAQHIDYVFPSFMVDETDILYRRRLSGDTEVSFLLRPFHPYVYVALLAVGIVVTILFIGVECFTSHNKNNVGSQQLKVDVMEISVGFIGAILRQVFRQESATVAGRVLLASWWLIVLLLTSVYCANLIASLSIQGDLSRLTTIEALVDSDYTVGMLSAGMPYESMKDSNDPAIESLFNKMVSASKQDRNIFSKGRGEHFERVKGGNYAFITYKSVAESYLLADCKLALLGESVTWAEEHLTLALSKGAPIKVDFDRVMYDLEEKGILDTLWKKWTTGSNSTSCEVNRVTSALTVQDLMGGIMVVCGGIGLSLLVLSVEICRQWLQQMQPV